MVALVDTNVLVYRVDPRSPRHQQIAIQVLRRGLRDDSLRIPHQAVLEFVSAVTRGEPGDALMSPADAREHAEGLLADFVILYPTEAVLRTAVRGWATYGLGWFDAHLWAYAEVYGLSEILSEDFQHDRLYGTVRVVNPFRDDAVRERRARWRARTPTAPQPRLRRATRVASAGGKS